MRLAVDEEELAACVSCGLCLPHCPTFRVTGEESASPRGRIAAMRVTHATDGPPEPELVDFLDRCVQCRACEVACPSSVPFGHLVEGARASLAEAGYGRRWPRLAYAGLGHHRLLLAGSSALAVAQRVGVVPRRLGLPRLGLRRPRLRASGTDAWLFTGCVMDAWMRPVHAAVKRVMEATGAGVALPGAGSDCCGALHVHGGLAADARRLARRVVASMPGSAPIVVDSAGCGAAMKEYGRLLGVAEGEAFSARVVDVHEWLAPRLDRLPPPRRRLVAGAGGPVAVQDPCHLRHVQRAHEHVRTVLSPYTDVVELDDEGMCCGAGGAYAVMQPELAGKIRSRKVEAVARTGAPVVASANPGCAMYLGAAGLDVRHPLELVDWALAPGPPDGWRLEATGRGSGGGR